MSAPGISNAEILRALSMCDLPHGEKSLLMFMLYRGKGNVWTAYAGTWDQSVAFGSDLSQTLIRKARVNLTKRGWLWVGHDESGNPKAILTATAIVYFRDVLDRDRIRRAFKPARWQHVLTMLPAEQVYAKFREYEAITPNDHHKPPWKHAQDVAGIVHKAIREMSHTVMVTDTSNRAISPGRRAISPGNRAISPGGNVIDLRKRAT